MPDGTELAVHNSDARALAVPSAGELVVWHDVVSWTGPLCFTFLALCIGILWLRRHRRSAVRLRLARARWLRATRGILHVLRIRKRWAADSAYLRREWVRNLVGHLSDKSARSPGRRPVLREGPALP